MLVEGEQDAVHVKRELLRIGVVAKMPAVIPPRNTRAIVLSRSAWLRTSSSRTAPGSSSNSTAAATNKQPPGSALVSHSSQFSKSALTRGSPWSSERRPDHQIHELVAGIPHRRQLQAFFRAEVGKQSALRHVRQFGEGPDGDASKSHPLAVRAAWSNTACRVS